MKIRRSTSVFVVPIVVAVSLISCGGGGQDEGELRAYQLGAAIAACDVLTGAMGTGSDYERVFAAAVLDAALKQVDGQESKTAVIRLMREKCGEAYRFAAAG